MFVSAICGYPQQSQSRLWFLVLEVLPQAGSAVLWRNVRSRSRPNGWVCVADQMPTKISAFSRFPQSTTRKFNHTALCILLCLETSLLAKPKAWPKGWHRAKPRVPARRDGTSIMREGGTKRGCPGEGRMLSQLSCSVSGHERERCANTKSRVASVIGGPVVMTHALAPRVAR